MAELKSSTSDKKFLKIAEGKIREKVPEGTQGAIARTWEAGGKSGTTHEFVFDEITGRITNVSFYEGEHEGKKFTSLNIELDKIDGKTPVLSVGLDSKYAGDAMKKLPNVDFNEEVKIRPFSFIPDGEEKPVVGMEFKQRDGLGQFEKKIHNFFGKKEGEKWVPANGFPVPEGDVALYSSDDWKIFYLGVKKFLVNYTKEHICSKFEVADEGIKYPDEDIKPEDIGF